MSFEHNNIVVFVEQSYLYGNRLIIMWGVVGSLFIIYIIVVGLVFFLLLYY